MSVFRWAVAYIIGYRKTVAIRPVFSHQVNSKTVERLNVTFFYKPWPMIVVIDTYCCSI